MKKIKLLVFPSTCRNVFCCSLHWTLAAFSYCTVRTVFLC